MSAISWSTERGGGTSLKGWFEGITNVDGAIAKLEAHAGMKGEWEMNDYGAWDWWGLTGHFAGEVFTVYTHKSGTLKIGGFDGLDVEGIKAALLEVING